MWEPLACAQESLYSLEMQLLVCHEDAWAFQAVVCFMRPMLSALHVIFCPSKL